MLAQNHSCAKSVASNTWSAENFVPCRDALFSTIRPGRMDATSSVMSHGIKSNHYVKRWRATAASSS